MLFWSLVGFIILFEEIVRFELNFELLKVFGGIKGVVNSLRVDLVKGIEGFFVDINLWKDVFGLNIYLVKKVKIFLVIFLNFLMCKFFMSCFNRKKNVE